MSMRYCKVYKKEVTLLSQTQQYIKTCLVKLSKRQQYVRQLSSKVLFQSNNKDNEYVTLLNNTTIIKIASNNVNNYKLKN